MRRLGDDFYIQEQLGDPSYADLERADEDAGTVDMLRRLFNNATYYPFNELCKQYPDLPSSTISAFYENARQIDQTGSGEALQRAKQFADQWFQERKPVGKLIGAYDRSDRPYCIREDMNRLDTLRRIHRGYTPVYDNEVTTIQFSEHEALYLGSQLLYRASHTAHVFGVEVVSEDLFDLRNHLEDLQYRHSNFNTDNQLADYDKKALEQISISERLLRGHIVDAGEVAPRDCYANRCSPLRAYNLTDLMGGLPAELPVAPSLVIGKEDDYYSNRGLGNDVRFHISPNTMVVFEHAGRERIYICIPSFEEVEAALRSTFNQNRGGSNYRRLLRRIFDDGDGAAIRELAQHEHRTGRHISDYVSSLFRLYNVAKKQCTTSNTQTGTMPG